jgi:hypothetical protein
MTPGSAACHFSDDMLEQSGTLLTENAALPTNRQQYCGAVHYNRETNPKAATFINL